MARQRANRIDGAVLVADDHEVLRIGVEQTLRQHFGVASVQHAGTYDDVIDRVAKPGIALAILDLDMPGLSGAHDLAKLRRMCPQLKVVVLSGSSAREDILAALAAGVNGYIVKTAKVDNLVARLEHVLAGEIYVPPEIADLGEPLHNGTAVETHPKPLGGAGLSDRQLQVLKGLVMGLSNKQIARELKLAEGTVKMHIGALFRALGAHNRAHAAALGKPLLD